MMNPRRARLTLLVAVTVTVCTLAATLAECRPSPTAAPTTTTEVGTTLAATTVAPTTTVAATVAATIEPTAPPITEELLCPEWRPVLLYVGFTGSDLETADRVLWAESRCQNTAVNDFDCHCGFQIHRPSWELHLRDRGIVYEWADITTDPVVCAAAAYHIATNYGWRQWSTF